MKDGVLSSYVPKIKVSYLVETSAIYRWIKVYFPLLFCWVVHNVNCWYHAYTEPKALWTLDPDEFAEVKNGSKPAALTCRPR